MPGRTCGLTSLAVIIRLSAGRGVDASQNARRLPLAVSRSRRSSFPLQFDYRAILAETLAAPAAGHSTDERTGPSSARCQVDRPKTSYSNLELLRLQYPAAHPPSVLGCMSHLHLANLCFISYREQIADSCNRDICATLQVAAAADTDVSELIRL